MIRRPATSRANGRGRLGRRRLALSAADLSSGALNGFGSHQMASYGPIRHGSASASAIHAFHAGKAMIVSI
jgi:hypothetical protein